MRADLFLVGTGSIRNTSSFLPSHQPNSRVTLSGASARGYTEKQTAASSAWQHDSNLFIALVGRRSLTALDWWYQSDSPLRTTQRDVGDKRCTKDETVVSILVQTLVIILINDDSTGPALLCECVDESAIITTQFVVMIKSIILYVFR